jgi:hypothetical protein
MGQSRRPIWFGLTKARRRIFKTTGDGGAEILCGDDPVTVVSTHRPTARRACIGQGPSARHRAELVCRDLFSPHGHPAPASLPISDFPNFLLTAGANQPYSDLVPSLRGACARYGRGAGCGGRWQRARRARPAGGRPSRVVLTPHGWRQVCEKKRRRRCQASLVTGKSAK